MRMKACPDALDGTGSIDLFTVGAVDCNIICAPYSNYGAAVDWVAVGTNVFSTYLYDTQRQHNWTYRVVNGTSMAAAVISGVIHASNKKPKKGPKALNCNPPLVAPPGQGSRPYHLGVH